MATQDRYDAAYRLCFDRLHRGTKSVQDDVRSYTDFAVAFARAYAERMEFTDPAAFWSAFSHERWLSRNPERAADIAKVARPRTHAEAVLTKQG